MRFRADVKRTYISPVTMVCVSEGVFNTTRDTLILKFWINVFMLSLILKLCVILSK